VTDGALLGGVTVLERAVAYALGGLALATPAMLSRPTPCAEWDLRDLLEHVADSMAALAEGAETGRVAASPAAGAAEIIPVVRARATRLLGAWAKTRTAAVRVESLALTTPLLAGAGAIELAVHGWDVAAACGRARPIPAALAAELLDLAVLLVRPTDRTGRFASPLSPPAGSPPGDRLLAFLGREPGRFH
jgi:uncharacterized protein (TIGR03086 family)